ncbi:dTDP-4-dehydrorhamnose reductase (EC [Olavius algarvensis associated proteobacterium Delta 3]|nr:dTDP-4-dehydrorhamnose reductase (EC [Olavius algarvensis associated proteobacterium Delta 3]CAB5156410.1 dTDP-4-dehydrorhamnose reductase (EC [Olavius algarvensis associated proteobacterium Delta 3]
MILVPKQKHPIPGKRLIVTGASGFLGWHICRKAVDEWTVCGVHRSHPIHLNGIRAINIDITDRHQFEKTFQEINPDAVVHTAAATDPNWCQVYPEGSEIMNVTVTSWIAEWCAESQIPLAFTSSDLVFEGMDPPYHEDSPTNPVCRYGEQKVRAEQTIGEIYPEALVCRMPLMFGWTGSELNNLDYHVIQSLRRGETVSLFTDEYRTPVDGESAAKGILHFLGKARGVLHLGGKTRISRYGMGKKLEDMLGLKESTINPVKQKDIVKPAPRPADVSLNSSKAFGMGYDPMALDSALEEAIKNLDAGRRSRLHQGSRPA